MSREGSHLGLLDQLHASDCDGKEFSACRPVVVPAGPDETSHWDAADRGGKLVVVIMAWCSECGAADWDFV